LVKKYHSIPTIVEKNMENTKASGNTNRLYWAVVVGNRSEFFVRGSVFILLQMVLPGRK
jgi:hypothetical protein